MSDLNELIDIHVMGRSRADGAPKGYWHDYEGDWRETGRLIEKMHERGFYFSSDWDPSRQFWCGFRSTLSTIDERSVTDASPRRAISMAALSALGVQHVLPEDAA